MVKSKNNEVRRVLFSRYPLTPVRGSSGIVWSDYNLRMNVKVEVLEFSYKVFCMRNLQGTIKKTIRVEIIKHVSFFV